MNYPNVEIVGVPTLREPDGLAMSSRNIYLSPEERKLAPMIYNELQTQNPELATRNLEAAGFKIQYLEQRWGRHLVAAYLGNTRLIDNIALK
jgi:pantoate--beta-alanine ligase